MAKKLSKRDLVQLRMSPERKNAFLAALRESGGIMATACRAASPHSPRLNASGTPACWSSFRAAMERDPSFNASVQEVLEQCRDDVEAEIHRRGQLGWTEPVFQKGERVLDHDGTPAVIRKFSDNLLLARARALMPSRYNEKRQVEHTGTIMHGAAGHLQITSADLVALNEPQRDQLSGILKVIQAARKGETPALEHHPAEVIDADFEEVAEPVHVTREIQG